MSKPNYVTVTSGYVSITIPHKRHERIRITESWCSSGTKSATKQYDVCKYCYIKMPPKRPRYKTVADFTDMRGGGVDADELSEELKEGR
jgi:hypothetical protein